MNRKRRVFSRGTFKNGPPARTFGLVVLGHPTDVEKLKLSLARDFELVHEHLDNRGKSAGGCIRTELTYHIAKEAEG